MKQLEFNATEIRKILQELFPARRLVLSQFTFFNASGVSQPSGETFRRGRRCYRLQDLLPLAAVLVLKEQGIPNKNAEAMPGLLKSNLDEIFARGPGSRASGYGDLVCMRLVGDPSADTALEEMLVSGNPNLYWSIDVGQIAQDLCRVSSRLFSIPTIGEAEEIRASIRAVA